MTKYNAKRKLFIGSLVLLVFCYLLWTLRPVNILRAGARYSSDLAFGTGISAGSKRGFTDREDYDIAVDHMPLTEWGRIHWYLEHKTELKSTYHIPETSSYSIVFWEVGSGFIDINKSGNGDLVCFNKIDESANCLEKNLLLVVDFIAGNQEEFTFYGGDHTWVIDENGRVKLQ